MADNCLCQSVLHYYWALRRTSPVPFHAVKLSEHIHSFKCFVTKPNVSFIALSFNVTMDVTVKTGDMDS